MPDPGEDLLRKALAGAVAGLDESRRLTVVEVAADGITTFDLRRDELGRPRCRFDPVVPWTSLAAGRGWDGAGHDLTRQDPTEEAVIRAAGVPSHAALILVCSFPDSPLAGQALAWLHAAFPEAAAFVQADVRVDALLRDVVVNDPLDRPYELVVLKRSVATGRFELAAHQLFTIGARSARSPGSPRAARRVTSGAPPSPWWPGAGGRCCCRSSRRGSSRATTTSRSSWRGRAGFVSPACPAW